MLVANLRAVSLEEALGSAGGYRSILGILKHVAGWSAVYHSYAFEDDPVYWDRTDWPRGLRDTIEPTTEYLDEVHAWWERTFRCWLTSIADADLEGPRPVHWGGTAPLGDIVVSVATHWAYHSGEINAVLAIQREEAWEYGEEVEENHISTLGHGVRPPWMSEEEADRWERS